MPTHILYRLYTTPLKWVGTAVSANFITVGYISGIKKNTFYPVLSLHVSLKFF